VLHTDIRYECWKDNKELPGILDDAILAANGYAVITEVKPTFDPITQKLTPQAPVKGADGVWTLGYNVVELDPAIVANNRNIIEVERVMRIQNQIRQGNQDVISAMLQNDAAAVEAWKIQLAALQAQL
jgi:hypothetical protein